MIDWRGTGWYCKDIDTGVWIRVAPLSYFISEAQVCARARLGYLNNDRLRRYISPEKYTHVALQSKISMNYEAGAKLPFNIPNRLYPTEEVGNV